MIFNHVTEIGMSWLVFGPRLARHVAGVVMLGFQILLILSGNLSFLNYLTIVPVLACFDDELLARVLPEGLVSRAEEAAERAAPSRLQQAVAVALAALIAFLSIAPVANLLSPGQVMNTSFGALDLVNTYGAFGSVGKVRYEIVLEGTSDETIDEATRWKPYEFLCKPGDPTPTVRDLAVSAAPRLADLVRRDGDAEGRAVGRPSRVEAPARRSRRSGPIGG